MKIWAYGIALPILAVAALHPAPEISAATTSSPACAMPANWGAAAFMHEKDKVTNYVYLKDGQLRWNGSPATEEQVRRYLTFVKRLRWQPITAIDSRGMDCAMAERLRSYVEESLPCTPDLCRFGAFEGVHPQTYVPPAPPAPPPPPRPRPDRALPPSGT